MEFEMNPYIVYVKTNSNGYITAVNSSAFLTDIAGWVEIDRGYGDKFHHAQGNFFQQPIYTMGGAYRYKLVSGKPVECTPEEIAAQEEANKPTPAPDGNLEERVTAVESDVADLTAAIKKGLSL
jgi:hypothetical protein